MSKVVTLKLRKSYLNFANAHDVIDALIRQGIIASVEDKNYIVVARYGTNKGKLRKVLND